MYTSCPECGTVFRITTHELRLAEGYVRCGHCSATFNAVASLADEPPPTVTLQQLVLPDEPADAVDPPPPEPAPAPVPGFPEEPAGPAAPPELQSGGTWVPVEVADDTLEFDLPEDSWDNFFEDGLPEAPRPPVAAAEAAPDSAIDLEAGADIETRSETPSETESSPPPTELAPEPAVDVDADTPDDADTDVGDAIGSATVDQAGIYRALAAEREVALDEDADWQALLAEVAEDEEDGAPEPVYVISDGPGPPAGTGLPATPPAADPAPLPAVVAGATTGAATDQVIAWDELPDDADPTRAPAPLPADFVPDLPTAAIAAGEPAAAPRREPAPFGDRPFVWQPPPAPPADTGPHRGYLAGSVLAALLLLTQLLHHNRDQLATHPALTEPLGRLYAALDLPLWPAWDLRAYELRSSEAVADRSQAGALDVLARIAVVGNEAVGLPLVRVTLRDRFNSAIGSRVFQPAEYLARATPLREPVAPGTLIPVEVSVKDPGRDAQGFDVDVCLMTRRDGLTCRSEREPFAR